MTWIGDESIRELILQRFLAIHQGITKANGYESEFSGAARILRALDEIDETECPWAMIVGGNEEEEEAGTGGYTRARFTVVVWVATYDVDHPSEAIEKAIRDCKVAVREDVHLGVHPDGTSGNLVENIDLTNIRTLEGEFQPWEAARFEWVVRYDYLKSRP